MKKSLRDKSSFKASKIYDVPPGEAFIQHSRELLHHELENRSLFMPGER